MVTFGEVQPPFSGTLRRGFWRWDEPSVNQVWITTMSFFWSSTSTKRMRGRSCWVGGVGKSFCWLKTMEVTQCAALGWLVVTWMLRNEVFTNDLSSASSLSAKTCWDPDITFVRAFLGHEQKIAATGQLLWRCSQKHQKPSKICPQYHWSWCHRNPTQF